MKQYIISPITINNEEVEVEYTFDQINNQQSYKWYIKLSLFERLMLLFKPTTLILTQTLNKKDDITIWLGKRNNIRKIKKNYIFKN